jgi:glycerol uptake facilitator-like aquaporin
MAVVGSGIMAQRLAGDGGSLALMLLCNAVATGAALVVLILVFGPLSGAHFNPAVTLVMTLNRALSPRLVAHLMFDAPAISAYALPRSGAGQALGEFVATFGLVGLVLALLRFKPEAIAYAVGLYITSAYWFTSSTSFANPAVTLARMFTESFSGIRAADVPLFILAELLGALAAMGVFGWLLKTLPVRAQANMASRAPASCTEEFSEELAP